MSPADFMISVETRSSIKRKARLPSITEAKAKKYRFDPSIIPEDNTIDQYYNRINEVLPGDRPKLRVMIPFEKTWEGVLDRQDKQASIISNLVARQANQDNLISSLVIRLDEQKIVLDELKIMVDELKITMDEHKMMLRMSERGGWTSVWEML
jgi:hypothetical protein